jgi:hypothetical protein
MAIINAAPMPDDGSGIAVNNHATDIQVETNSTLFANVGNSQDAQFYANGFKGPMRLSDGNSVSNINAGQGSRITNNVGNSYNSGTDPRNLTNIIGNLTVGDHGVLVNNIGATINNNNQTYTTQNTIHNITNVTQQITNNFVVDGKKSDLGPLGAVLISMISRLQEIAGKVRSVTFTFHAASDGTATDLTKPIEESVVPFSGGNDTLGPPEINSQLNPFPPSSSSSSSIINYAIVLLPLICTLMLLNNK